MSGLFGQAELFAKVSDEWDKALWSKYPGKIRYFKLDEALTLSGEFAHWGAANRDEKIRQMASVINLPELLNVGALLDLEAFSRIRGWSHLKGHHSLSRPYLQLFQYVFLSTVSEAVDHGETRPMEIVFDEHDLFRPVIVDGYNDLKEIESEDPRRLAVLPLLPGFRDDKDFVMLQAADLLAGQMRLVAENGDNADFLFGLCPNLRVSRYFRIISDQDLQQMSELLLAKHRDYILGDSPSD